MAALQLCHRAAEEVERQALRRHRCCCCCWWCCHPRSPDPHCGCWACVCVCLRVCTPAGRNLLPTTASVCVRVCQIAAWPAAAAAIAAWVCCLRVCCRSRVFSENCASLSAWLTKPGSTEHSMSLAVLVTGMWQVQADRGVTAHDGAPLLARQRRPLFLGMGAWLAGWRHAFTVTSDTDVCEHILRACRLNNRLVGPSAVAVACAWQFCIACGEQDAALAMRALLCSAVLLR